MKKLTAVFLVLLLVVSTVAFAAPTASAESLYIRKIVSVVYDDSGSMKGDKWAYANYAMQAFCGMLNSEDRLFITYMSQAQTEENPKPKEIDLSASKISDSVDAVRSHSTEGKIQTPFKAAEIAFDKLKSVDDSNASTQYWLVVITDGAFDEVKSKPMDERVSFLNERLGAYTKEAMPNGTNPQITFLGIGKKTAAPDEATGIYTYSSKTPDDIVETMSSMADRVSGRTRLGENAVKQISETTIQVDSSIPLLNIAVLTQKTDSKIIGASFNSEGNIPISRSIAISYQGYDDLSGRSYLLGNSSSVIAKGSYNIIFDKPVSLSDVDILFEPALETRVAVSINGEEIKDLKKLDQVNAGDKISAKCKIYEMGTDTEVDPSLLPSGTTFDVKILEKGKVKAECSDSSMELDEYTLNEAETEISAAVKITGFNAISYHKKFTPTKHLSKFSYEIKPEFTGKVRSLKFEDVSKNKELKISFSVYADGKLLTDGEKVKALAPIVTVTPEGNGGKTEITDDGKIVFTPGAAVDYSENSGSYKVDVECSIQYGASAKETYTVLTAKHAVVALGASGSIRKTKLYGNKTNASFYVTRDEKRLDKEAVEGTFSAALEKEYENIKLSVEVQDDGTVICTPYSTKEYKLNFFNWWINWWTYLFSLPGDDVTVCFNHPSQEVKTTIDVVGESAGYIILNVVLPLLIELAVLAFFITWAVLFITKPRFGESAKLYVGEIRYKEANQTHIIRDFRKVMLKNHNTLANLWKFKKTPEFVPVRGLSVRAESGTRIFCRNTIPWYKARVVPYDNFEAGLNTPAGISEYFNNHRSLEICEFATTECINGENQRTLTANNQNNPKYIVVDAETKIIDGRRVIKSGKIFIYTT